MKQTVFFLMSLLFSGAVLALSPRPPQPIALESVQLANYVLSHSVEINQKLSESDLAGAYINGGTLFIAGPSNAVIQYKLTLQTCPLSSSFGTCDPQAAILTLTDALINGAWRTTITVTKSGN